MSNYTESIYKVLIQYIYA